MQAAVDQLAELLAEAGAFQGRLPSSISCKSLQQRLEEIQSVQQLCEEVLAVEGAVSLLGSGPRGMQNEVELAQIACCCGCSMTA